MTTHRPYLQRLAHVLATVGIAFGILAAAPMAEAFRTSGPLRHAESHSRLGAAPEGDLIARIAIPRIHLDAPVFEGVSAAELARGAGHLPGTANPGEEGSTNHCVLAISRDGSAASVDQARVGDAVTMRTPFGVRSYRVVEKRILDPEAVEVGPTRLPRVTLVTPYPADSAGPAPQRLAVVLERD